MNVLLIDNDDSFTLNLKDYIAQCSQKVTLANHRNLNEINFQDFDSIVISPGPKRPQDMPLLLNFVKKAIGHIPILGICLGHQAIGELFGMKLVHASTPKHGIIESINYKDHPIFNNIPNPFLAMRYHSLILEGRVEDLEIICTSSKGEIMGIAHKNLKVVGLQFHPESIGTPFGWTIIKNWFEWI